jgi:hypothetical protein
MQAIQEHHQEKASRQTSAEPNQTSAEPNDASDEPAVSR